MLRALTPRPSRCAILALAALALSALLACGVEEKPIGRLMTERQELALGYPEHRNVRMRLRPSVFPIAGGCPTVFVHLTDPSGRVLRTFDHRPPVWQPGKEVAYDLTIYQSAIAEPLAGGRYRLLAGIYSPDLGMRHALEFAGEEAGTGRYEIGSVTVRQAALAWEPVLAGGWEDPEAGGDSQVLTRRWFRRQATVRLRHEAARQPIELWLQLYLPRAGPADTLHLFDGAKEPRLEAALTCTSDRASLAPGRRELRFVVPTAGLQQGCSLDLRANYELRSALLATPRSASLEAISWIADR